jgi:hypothetical protein
MRPIFAAQLTTIALTLTLALPIALPFVRLVLFLA